MDNMSLIEQLDNKLKEAYMKGCASFIVMNGITSKMVIEEMIELPFSIMVLTKYEDLDVLISESLKDGEFRIG